MTAQSQHKPARADLRRTALQALYDWQVTTFQDVREMAAEHDATGQDVLVIMRATTNELEVEFEEATDAEWRETLLSIDIASAGAGAILTRENTPDRWADYVQLWDDVREVIQYTTAGPVPAGMILDLDRDVVCTYDAFYCPDLGGPEAVDVIDASEPPFTSDDPFDALLAQCVVAPDPEDRIEMLLDAYGLTVPSAPAHPEGACDEQD